MSDVINRTTKQYLKSVNTPDYSDTDWIINPDLSSLTSVPQKYWKISGDNVLEMNTEEKAAVDYAIGGSILNENYKVEEYNNGQILNKKYYQTKNLDDTYSQLAKTETYTYIGNNLKQIDTVKYDSIGKLYEHQVMKFYTDNDKVLTESSYI